jgi:ubiquitin C-terminal hydrolase
VTLPVDIAGETSLQNAINNFLTKEETVKADEWICPGCKKGKTYQKKQNVITECPAMLLVQLKLFATVFVEGSEGVAKQNYLRHRVKCEEQLSVHDHCYRLHAKVYHEGEALNSGHYYTICRHAFPQGAWWYFNDSTRRLAHPRDHCPPNARVYLCLYSRE